MESERSANRSSALSEPPASFSARSKGAFASRRDASRRIAAARSSSLARARRGAPPGFSAKGVSPERDNASAASASLGAEITPLRDLPAASLAEYRKTVPDMIMP
jgi:hypothetical protein